MKNLILIVSVALSSLLHAGESPTKVRSASCLVDKNLSEGGFVEVSHWENSMTTFSVQAEATGDYSLIDISFTRALQQLKYIALDESIAAISYYAIPENCEHGVSSIDAKCSEHIGQFSVLIRKKDLKGRITEYAKTFEADSIEVRSSRQGNDNYINWQLTKNGKWASTGFLHLNSCTYGENLF